MLGALLPPDVRPADPQVPVGSVSLAGAVDGIDLSGVGFYVPPYMGPRATFELMAHLPRLQVVQLLTAGFESALPFLPPGVLLCNARGVHDASTSELAVALTLASLRGIDDFARAMPQGAWLSSRRPALADKRVVVIGAGGVGQGIRQRLEPFETEVVLVGRAARDGVEGVDGLPALLPTADIVILAVPHTPETTRMVDARFLGMLPDGCLLVNVARGGVVDTEALLGETASGRLRAALDVTEPEPLPPDHPLWRLPNVLISPHVGGNTSAFLPRARRLVLEQLARWRGDEPVLHVVSG